MENKSDPVFEFGGFPCHEVDDVNDLVDLFGTDTSRVPIARVPTEPSPVFILSNGRAFAALVGEVVYLPDGRAISEEDSDGMGYEECVGGELTFECQEAVKDHHKMQTSSSLKEDDANKTSS